ncbi:hypothetical protein Tco_0819470 [Tanacetum coccineum]|uniref:Uncharacterized protein n=1 Tax=Tanacetum coccineum TaxID=301880 RepID=A0ABQ5A7L2_9ASTR
MVLPDNQDDSPKSVLENEMFEISSNEYDFEVDGHPNDEEVNNDNVVIPKAPNEKIITRIYNTGIPSSLIREYRIWDKIENPLSPNLIEHGDEVFSTWMAFGGNTRDLGSFGEEIDEITDLHQILEEVLLTERGGGVASIKRRHHDLFNDGVWNLETASGRGRLKEDLESST